jgi:hypothetical protein
MRLGHLCCLAMCHRCTANGVLEIVRTMMVVSFRNSLMRVVVP